MLVRRLSHCDEFMAGDNSILRELFHPDKVPVAIRCSLAHASVAAGETTLAHRLKTAEVYYILSGSGRMHIGDESAQVDAGCAVYIPPGAVQYIENTGRHDLLFLCIVDPAWREADEEIVEAE
jgi:mannose-6-phosphate isomerase-like protein (cupin superfamily)